MSDGIRWGILSTASIGRSAFLPALRAAGGGVAWAVAGRDLERATQFAQEQGVDHAVAGYARLLEDERVDAVYIPLPNSLHAEWTEAALRAGKTVLCEKPLCVSAEETERVLQTARDTGCYLWEAFVFPFRRQTQRLQELISDGAIGEVVDIHASHHFKIREGENIRLHPELGGGATYDVGCYGIRLARLVFGSEAESAVARPWRPAGGVDEEMRAMLTFPGDHTLMLSCGLRRMVDTTARLVGEEGEIRMSNPYHPNARDTLEIRRGGEVQVEHPNEDEPSFTDAIRHIHAVLRDEEEPRHLAVSEALGNASAIDLVLASAAESG